MSRQETLERDVKYCSSCQRWTTHVIDSRSVTCFGCGKISRKPVIHPIEWVGDVRPERR